MTIYQFTIQEEQHSRVIQIHKYDYDSLIGLKKL